MSQQAGWYDDPQDADLLRYWDGVQWTSHTSPRQRPDLGRAGQGSTAAGPGQQEQQGSPAYGAGSQGPQTYGQGSQGPQTYGQGSQGPQTYGQGQQAQGQWGAQQNYPAYSPAPGVGDYTDPRSVTPDGQLLAGWFRRFVARILDFVLFVVLTTALVPVLAPDLIEDFTAWIDEVTAAVEAGATTMPLLPESVLTQTLVLGVVTTVLILAYEIVLTTLAGGTLGKLALGVRVRLRAQPGKVGWGTSVIRALVWNAPSLVSYIPLIGGLIGILGVVFLLLNGLWPLWDGKRQSINDKAAKTNVVLHRQ